MGLINLSHINVFINASVWQVSLCCMLLWANDFTSHLQDVTTVKLAIKQFY